MRLYKILHFTLFETDHEETYDDHINAFKKNDVIFMIEKYDTTAKVLTSKGIGYLQLRDMEKI